MFQYIYTNIYLVFLIQTLQQDKLISTVFLILIFMEERYIRSHTRTGKVVVQS